MTNISHIDLTTEANLTPSDPYADSHPGRTEYSEQRETWMTPGLTDEDVLAEVPQAFAAYLASQRNQWG